MTNASVTFGLDIGYYDSVAEADADKEVVLATPQLSVFFSANAAAANREGLDIVEGDLWFFAFDGSPLEACFSKRPYMDPDRGTYFPGIYSLQLGIGKKLQDVIADYTANNPSPHMQIVVWLPDIQDDELAQEYGWSDVKAMKEGVDQALKIFPLDLAKRIVFKEPYGRPSASRYSEDGQFVYRKIS